MLVGFAGSCALAQESPFFVTYNHHMEERGNLDLEVSSTSGVPRKGQRFYFAPYMEAEYGVTDRWTSSLYLEGQSTAGDSSVFTGWRLENRYKVLSREHWINPVLYLEYEDLNEASKIQKEIEGSGPDLASRNALLTSRWNHELEGKLILSSDYHGWNISENFIVAKNFSQSEGLEFGYSAGISHPLGATVPDSDCAFCWGSFVIGLESYGGLGSTLDFGVRRKAQYIAPVMSWAVTEQSTLRFSPGFGLTQESSLVLIRFGYTHEIDGFGSKLASLFRRR